VKAFKVFVRTEDEDAATAILWEAGTAGLEVQPGRGSGLALLAYFADDTDLETLESGFRSLGNARITPEPIPMVDWVARFRESFQGFRAGSFDVVPAWDVPAGRRPADPDLLVVDPGRAFGTGTHETTRLCLAALEARASVRSLGRVLDVGTGSGLLGVAAAKRGASLAVGTDTDPEATGAAQRHASLNGVALSVVRADGGRGFRTGRFDLVLANLMASLLVERRSELMALLADGAALVLSGLLDTDVAEVAAAYEAMGTPEVRADGEWAALVFPRSA
jgi:ribosomal protein L11 methyltransferase